MNALIGTWLLLMTVVCFVVVMSYACGLLEIKESVAFIVISAVLLGMLIASAYLLTGGM